MSRLLILGTALLIAQATSSSQCGSSSPSSSTPVVNTAAIVVNGGPANNGFNEPYTTVTVCVPGTSNCQTIGGILVDTGSVGLRLLSSTTTLPLPQQTGANGAPVVECLPFVDGFTWGPVSTADIQIAGERASSVPIQLIGVNKFPSVPTSCSSNGPSEENVNDLGANGILGIGTFIQDCGLGCTFPGTSNPGLYYMCPTITNCVVTPQPLASQLQNPIAFFSSDNNGSMIQLPAVQVGGQATTAGSLVFGIGTQSDNALGTAHVQTLDSQGNFTTVFNGQPYPGSFIDSGSNAIFFLDTSTTGLALCPFSTGFYCPPSNRAFSANNVGINGVTVAVPFTAGNVDNVNETFSVFGEATGENPGSFDWGLPFFYGRTVFNAIETKSTPGGIGPYWAY